MNEQEYALARDSASEATSPSDFTRVVESHWTAVYRMIHQLTGNRHDADDLTQETFARALAAWHSFAAGTNVRAWLLRIASNLFLDEHRKRRRRGVQSLECEVAGFEPSPDSTLETREQAALARAVLEKLSETTRLVFHLRVSEELPYREIAAMIGVTEEAARWHMRHARVTLLQRLENEKEDRT